MAEHPPIEDDALIGDCESAALVSLDGGTGWLCWPRFDSEACFAALLGERQHGHWTLAPACAVKSRSRCYRGDTLILETTFETGGGGVKLIDFMPIRSGEQPVSSVVRIVEGVRAEVSMRMDLYMRFDYGRVVPWLTRTRAGHWRAVAGPHSAVLFAPWIIATRKTAPSPNSRCGPASRFPS